MTAMISPSAVTESLAKALDTVSNSRQFWLPILASATSHSYILLTCCRILGIGTNEGTNNYLLNLESASIFKLPNDQIGNSQPVKEYSALCTSYSGLDTSQLPNFLVRLPFRHKFSPKLHILELCKTSFKQHLSDN